MIETKEVRLSDKQYIEDLKVFGWQATQESSRRSGRSTYHYQIMARETTMPHYNDLRRCEIDYESAKDDLKLYDSMEASTVLLLLLLFIFPGIIYIVYKSNQKSNINAHNSNCREKMRRAMNDARNIK